MTPNYFSDFTTAFSSGISLTDILLSLLLAFVLGQLLAWVYYFTHSGLSYSRSFIQSIIVITVIVSMVMASIGNSLVTAVGLMGALAIIRFRNIIKDTKDMSYIFGSLVIGMSVGSGNYSVAVAGTVVICLILLYLYWTDFGSHQPHNGFLRFSTELDTNNSDPLQDVLKKFCKSFRLISVSDEDHTSHKHYSYQLYVTDSSRNEEMIKEIEKIAGIGNINLTMQEQLLEV